MYEHKTQAPKWGDYTLHESLIPLHNVFRVSRELYCRDIRRNDSIGYDPLA
jgi:hypothetical protein